MRPQDHPTRSSDQDPADQHPLEDPRLTDDPDRPADSDQPADADQPDQPGDADQSDQPAGHQTPAGDRRDGADPPVLEPAPLPTAFGATSVGAAVAASAMAGHGRGDRADMGDDPATRDLPEDEPGGSRGYHDSVAPRDVPTPTAVGTVPAEAVEAAVPAEADEAAVPAVPAEADGADAKPDAYGQPAAAEALWDEDTVTGLRDRWREVQLRFVDDPYGAAGDARALVGEAVDALTSALERHRRTLDDGWQSADAKDTERLRVAVRSYRELLDRLLTM